MSFETENNIINLVQRAKNAQLSINNLSENKINKILRHILKIILDKKNNFYLSEMAVNETKFGNISDKIKKNQYKTEILSSLRDRKRA